MTREEIEQLADKRYPTAKDVDASLTTMAERNGWIAGFEAGMQSMIDNIPDLEWKDSSREFYEEYHETCFDPNLLCRYSIVFYLAKGYTLYFAYQEICDSFITLDDAKRYAENDYKNRIKKTLGL